MEFLELNITFLSSKSEILYSCKTQATPINLLSTILENSFFFTV